ncbi:MAG: hypothetical protein QM765_24700 [Myxococcales bacterium]
MTVPGAAALLLVAALSAGEGSPERVLVIAPRPPASPSLLELTRAVSAQLGRFGKRVVIPDPELRKALEQTHSPPLTDLDDPAQIALALQLVDADYLVSVVSARTLIVRSSSPGKPSGRLVATAGGEAADLAMDSGAAARASPPVADHRAATAAGAHRRACAARIPGHGRQRPDGRSRRVHRLSRLRGAVHLPLVGGRKPRTQAGLCEPRLL